MAEQECHPASLIESGQDVVQIETLPKTTENWMAADERQQSVIIAGWGLVEQRDQSALHDDLVCAPE